MSQSVDTVTTFAAAWDETDGLYGDQRSAHSASSVRKHTDREIARLVHAILAPFDGGPAPRQVTFCGVEQGAATSRICAGTAKALEAVDGASVCMVEGNIVDKPLSKLFGLSGGDTERAFGRSLKERCLQLRGNLWIAGPELFTSPTRMAASFEQLTRLLQELGQVFDYILVDTPNLKQSSTGVLFGRSTDATIMVLDATIKKHLARKAKDTLEASEVRILGTVLTNREFPIPEALYKRL